MISPDETLDAARGRFAGELGRGQPKADDGLGPGHSEVVGLDAERECPDLRLEGQRPGLSGALARRARRPRGRARRQARNGSPSSNQSNAGGPIAHSRPSLKKGRRRGLREPRRRLSMRWILFAALALVGFVPAARGQAGSAGPGERGPALFLRRLRPKESARGGRADAGGRLWLPPDGRRPHLRRVTRPRGRHAVSLLLGGQGARRTRSPAPRGPARRHRAPIEKTARAKAESRPRAPGVVRVLRRRLFRPEGSEPREGRETARTGAVGGA